MEAEGIVEETSSHTIIVREGHHEHTIHLTEEETTGYTMVTATKPSGEYTMRAKIIPQ